MRKAFAEALFQAAEKDPRVIFLTGDLGFGTFDAYQAKFGPRYVNVGVAEAQLVNAAAGLALEGWRPIIYSIASFATGRPFEQIRISVGYAGLPVVIIGAGGGYTYASSGVTHHAGEDLGLMSLIPGMTVVAPGDPNEVTQLLPQLLKLDGPSYLRVGKYVANRLIRRMMPSCSAVRGCCAKATAPILPWSAPARSPRSFLMPWNCSSLTGLLRR